MLRDALPSSRRVVYPMGMPATVNDWTVDMLDALPEDGQRPPKTRDVESLPATAEGEEQD